MSTANGYHQFEGQWQENAQLAWDTIHMRPTQGVAPYWMNVMDWGLLESIGGHQPGSYAQDPSRVYLDFQLAVGTTMIDQWIPDNPLSLTEEGCESGMPRGATTGAERIVRDGMLIDSTESVVAHMEQFLFPQLDARGRELDVQADERAARLVEKEVQVQKLYGMNLLKGPYDGFQYFPGFNYFSYGYENYFMAYGLYP